MPVLKLSPFGGMIPARDNRVLPDQASAYSEDVYLGAGDLRGFRPETLIRTLTNSAAKYVFRIPTSPTAVNAGFGSSTWMEFTDIDTNVLRSPISSDIYNRYYWASPSDVPRYNPYSRIVTSAASYKLGVPAPTVAPGLTVTGGTADPEVLETRAYVYTWQTIYGEEGPPSPATVVTGRADGSWNVTVTPPDGSQSAERALGFWRLYRTITAVGGSTTFFNCGALGISSTAYSDTVPNSVISGAALLESTAWVVPPATLQGMVAMPNGIFAGWEGSSIYFSEPYRPHAWPVAYSLTVDYPIIGIGVFGQSIVVCTTGYPSIISGIHPSQMAQMTFPMLEPCMARGSIVSTPSGVIYASSNGLVVVNQGGVKNFTEDLLYREMWLHDIAPWGIRGVSFEGSYIGYTGLPRSAAGLGFLVAPPPTAFTWLNDPVATKNLQTDFWSGQVMHIHDGGIYQYNPPSATGMSKYKWQSKEFTLPKPTNFAAAKVIFSLPTGVVALNPTPNDTLEQSLAVDQYALFKAYADGRHVYTREIRISDKVFKLPSGFKATIWQFEIEGRIIIHTVEIATSAKELRQV
jgi:hypothetical protein